jgi:hypothetical protein
MMSHALSVLVLRRFLSGVIRHLELEVNCQESRAGKSGGSLLTHPLSHSGRRERLQGCPLTRVLRAKPFPAIAVWVADHWSRMIASATHQ